MNKLLLSLILVVGLVGCKEKKPEPEGIEFTIGKGMDADAIQWLDADSSNFRSYFSITDSAAGEVAHWEDGKWEITDCEKALTVMVASNKYLNDKIMALEKRIYGTPSDPTPDTVYALGSPSSGILTSSNYRIQ